MSKTLAVTKLAPFLDQPVVIRVENPFQPDEYTHKYVEVGDTVAQCLDNEDLSTRPTLVMLNQTPLLESEWETTHLEKGDVLSLVATPGGIGAVIMIIVLVITAIMAAYSLYTILTMDEPDPGEKNNSPNYSVGYRGNQRRPGQPIPVVYGEMRVYPDYTGKYATYRDNHDQWLYQIFDITLGEIEDVDASEIYYEDTPLSNFESFEYEIVPPGQVSTLFPKNVEVSSEVSSLDLRNELEWTVAYSANPVGTEITTVIVDLSCPSGCYWVHHRNGEFRWLIAQAAVQWRLFGTEDVWGTIVVTLDYSTRPIHKTVRIPVAPGRYEVRCCRYKRRENASNATNELSWVSLKGEEADDIVTETTRIALAIRASATIGNSALSELSLQVRRKISLWTGSAWTIPQHTKLACHAFIDACRASYGGNLPEELIDLAHLISLEAEGVEFNGVFDSKNTLWKALGDIARPMNGRAVQKSGGIYSIALDLPDEPPVAMFTMRNIIRDTFVIEHNFPENEETNFTRVTFKNRLEAYRETTIDCVPIGVVQNRPHEVRLRGVTDKDAAYTIGIRMANENRHRRKSIDFQTTLMGFIPSPMQTIRVGHYLIGQEQTIASVSGEVKSNSGNVLTVFEDMTDQIGEVDLQCYLMDVDGSPWGPVSCTIPSAYVIDLGGNTPPAGILDYAHNIQGPKFCVGNGSDFMITAKILSVSHAGDHKVRIQALEDSPNVYLEDTPPSYSPLDPPADISPTVQNLTGVLIGSGETIQVKLDWEGKYADYYLVELSEDDGVVFEELGRPVAAEFLSAVPLQDGLIFRVSGVSLFIGAPATVVINALNRDVSFPSIYNLRPLYAFSGRKIGVTWDAIPDGQYAWIRLKFNGAILLERLIDNATSFVEMDRDEVMQFQARSFLGTTFPAAGCRTVEAELRGTTEVGGVWQENAESAQLTMTNDPMGRILNLTAYIDYISMVINFDWPENDPGAVFVHLSLNPTFTPDASNLVHFGDSNSFIVTGYMEHPNTYYVRVGACDRWGPDSVDYWPEFSVTTEEPVPPIDEGMLDPDLLARIDLIDKNPVVGSETADGAVGEIDKLQTDLGLLDGRVTINEGDIITNEGDLDVIEGHFVAGVLEVVHGGTGVTTSTGNTSVVLSDGATMTALTAALTAASTGVTHGMGDNTTKLATTEWVLAQDLSGGPPDLSALELRVTTNEGDILVLQGYFVADVLQVVHGGTGVTTSTGTGSTVLSSGATMTNLTAALASGSTGVTAPNADSTTKLATTAWVMAQDLSGGPPDLSALEARIAANEDDIVIIIGDLDVIESHFVAGVLEVVHGGTGVTTSTGSGNVVLSASPTLTGNPIAPTQSSGNSSTRIATTAFVKNQGYGDAGDLAALTIRVTDNEGDIATNKGDLDVIEGHFIIGVLQIEHGGTGATTATGTGQTVLATSPTLTGNPKSVTPSNSDWDTSIATTAFVKNQGYGDAGDLSALTIRVTDNEGDIATNKGDLDTIQGVWFAWAGVLGVLHGGTGQTTSTGSGSVVLKNSPTLTGNPKAPTPATEDADTSIATTLFVKNQGYIGSGVFSALETRVDDNEGDINTNRTDLDIIEGHFVGNVLAVEHGGTGVTVSTGTGEVVLSNSPDFDGNATATTQTSTNNSTRIATTAFVKSQNYLVDSDLTALENRVGINEGELDTVTDDWFQTIGVLAVAHGGTGVTTSTGTGEVVLSNSPDFDGNATATTQTSTDNSTRIATTAFVKNQNYTTGGGDYGDLDARITANYNDIVFISDWFGGYAGPSWVLEVAHGGTGVTTSTGTGENVLSNSPDFDGNATATTQGSGNSSTRIATTAFVQGEITDAIGVTFETGSNSNGYWEKNNSTGRITQWMTSAVGQSAIVVPFPRNFTDLSSIRVAGGMLIRSSRAADPVMMKNITISSVTIESWSNDSSTHLIVTGY